VIFVLGRADRVLRAVTMSHPAGTLRSRVAPGVRHLFRAHFVA
jgi:hypothetical protein